MSRSMKKFPYCKDVNSSKWGKKICNRKIRRIKEDIIPNGNAYRRMTQRWDYIYDYCCSETWKEYKQNVEYPRWWRKPEEADYYDWYKTYKMK